MSAFCIHCDAVLSTREKQEGWCDSCGKKLPAEQRRSWKRPARVATVARAEEPGIPWYLAILVGVILLVACFFGFTILFGEGAGVAFLAKAGGRMVVLLVLAVVAVVGSLLSTRRVGN